MMEDWDWAEEEKRKKTRSSTVSQTAVTECRLGKQEQCVPRRRANQRIDDLSAA